MTGLLQRVMNVEPEEVAPILMAALYFFCILVALQILRPAREALGLERGIEAIRWLFMGTLVVTLFVNPIFGWLVSRFRKMTFIAATYLFFASNLLVFFALLVFAPQSIGEVSGMVFYVWMSVFNLFVTMVFWALMADRFSYDQSKRLFGAIAVGGTVGAIVGSGQAWVLAERIGTPALLVIAAAFPRRRRRHRVRRQPHDREVAADGGRDARRRRAGQGHRRQRVGRVPRRRSGRPT
jgi:ATP:ADP antiporter, AAA family